MSEVGADVAEQVDSAHDAIEQDVEWGSKLEQCCY
jgi:hypothetical protein